MSIEEIREKVRLCERKIRFRNAREYMAVAAITVFFAWRMVGAPDNLMRAGMGLCIAGGWFVAWQIHRRASARPTPVDLALTAGLQFHRAELVRQRDFLSGVWRWYLAPLLPGIALIGIAAAHAAPGRLAKAWPFLLGYLAVISLAFYGVGRLNLSAARSLQTSIDELDAQERAQ